MLTDYEKMFLANMLGNDESYTVSFSEKEMHIFDENDDYQFSFDLETLKKLESVLHNAIIFHMSQEKI